MPRPSPPSHVAFGIGCYSFTAPDADNLLLQNPEGKYLVQDWAQDVELALKAIPGLDEISVLGFGSVRGETPPTWRTAIEDVFRDEPDSPYHPGGDLLPHPVSGRIAFAATIPTHTQMQVFSPSRAMHGTRFEIDIRYGYGMPVAFVRAPDGEVAPSMAVAIVREFLWSEFAQRASDADPIRFTCMGPSPMWNDCFVAISDDPLGVPLAVEVLDTPGYQTINFSVQATSEVADKEDAYEFVKESTQDELQLYFDLISRRNLLDLHLSFIEASLESLVWQHRSTRISDRLSRFFRGGQQATDLILEILAAESEYGRAFGGASAEWQEVRGRSMTHPFDKAFERELSNESSVYFENARSVVTFLNERHGRENQAVSVIASSLLGGLVGAAITAVVQRVCRKNR